ncbi:MAG: deaminase [Candidatus Staskawiczbacteria bacterium]|nr:deaminase [Candidatus Staskawiczbacteria bacterium]
MEEVKEIPQDVKENSERPSKDQYYLQIAKEIGERSTCYRQKMGAIIVRDGQIIATGYIGAPRKTKDCLERGECLRDKFKIPHGTRYEICRSVHAEQNAIINAARAGVNILGGDLYMYSINPKTGHKNDALPCFFCKRMIINSGMKRVISSLKEGDVKIFLVDDWAKEWRENDIVDDKQQYGADQNVRDGLGGNPLGNNCNCS